MATEHVDEAQAQIIRKMREMCEAFQVSMLDGHDLGYYPPGSGHSGRSRNCRQCAICSLFGKRRSRVSSACVECDVTLCTRMEAHMPRTCFQVYHLPSFQAIHKLQVMMKANKTSAQDNGQEQE